MFKTIFSTKSNVVSEFKSKKWLRVFYHNSKSESDCFESESEALHCNSENKFSILDEIDDSMKIRNKFEFIIEYPNEAIYYHWRQSKNPLEEVEEEGKFGVDGFEPIHNGTSDTSWGGLTKTKLEAENVISTLLDGNPGTIWWRFSIGKYCVNKGWEFKDSLPGPLRKEYKQIRLWIRINHYNELFSCRKRPKVFIDSLPMITLTVPVIKILTVT